MSVSAVIFSALLSQQQNRDTRVTQGSGTFASAMDSAAVDRKPQPHVFRDAPDFVIEWAQKYNVHIIKSLVRNDSDGTIVKHPLKLPTVNIHPTALARMLHDLDFRRSIEEALHRFAIETHKILSRNRDGLAGGVINIYADGSFGFRPVEERETVERPDTWEMTKVLMKTAIGAGTVVYTGNHFGKNANAMNGNSGTSLDDLMDQIDIMCEEMRGTNAEKIVRQLGKIEKNRAIRKAHRNAADILPALVKAAEAE